MQARIDTKVVVEGLLDTLKDCCLDHVAKNDYSNAGNQGRCGQCNNIIKSVTMEFIEDPGILIRGANRLESDVAGLQTRRFEGKADTLGVMLSKSRFSPKEAREWVEAYGFHVYKQYQNDYANVFEFMDVEDFKSATLSHSQFADGVTATIGVLTDDVLKQSISIPTSGVCPNDWPVRRGDRCFIKSSDKKKRTEKEDAEKNHQTSQTRVLRRYAIKGALDIQSAHSHHVWVMVDKNTGMFTGQALEVQGHRHTCTGKIDQVSGQIVELSISEDLSPVSGTVHDHGHSQLVSHAFLPAPGLDSDGSDAPARTDEPKRFEQSALGD